MTDQEMIELEPEILKTCEERILLRDQLARLVVKERWFNSDELKGSVKFEKSIMVTQGNGDSGAGCSIRTYGLKHVAVHSARINISESVDKQLIKFSMGDTAYWIWSAFFRDELLKLIQRRLVARDLRMLPINTLELTRISSSNARRINIFGTVVPQFLVKKYKFGTKYIQNPKYKRSAEQIIFFHPDIAHFQFPDVNNWIGDIQWKNVSDAEVNPDGQIGFYRLIATAAAKPVYPDLGTVVTVVPKGLRGFIYYWAWKLFRFVP